MPPSKPCMDLDLLEVGSWLDKGALDRESTILPRQQQSENQRQHSSAEPRKGYRSETTEPAGLSRQQYRNRHTKSEYQLLNSLTRDVVEAIQRQHPACFMKAEGGQQGSNCQGTRQPFEDKTICPQICLNPRLLGDSEGKFRKVVRH